MQFEETQRLDFDKTYPCPSCRQGSLIPITLTEAWGCDRCKQIFELTATNSIGKLATPYHRQRTWRWNGKQWLDNGQRTQIDTIKSWFVIAVLGGLLWVALSRIAPGFFIVGMLALILLLVVMFWVLRRR